MATLACIFFVAVGIFLLVDLTIFTFKRENSESLSNFLILTIGWYVVSAAGFYLTKSFYTSIGIPNTIWMLIVWVIASIFYRVFSSICYD
jgi:hypothetical protein